MFNVLTLNNISSVGTDYLPKDDYNISSDCENPDAIMLRSFNMHDYDLPESVRAVARAGAGVNNIPLDKCTERGVIVFNTPGANANAVKELVIAGLLLSSRKIYQGVAWANSLKGQEGIAGLIEKGKAEFVGPEILGKKLGVVGLGAIGVLVANCARSLGLSVIGYDPFLSVEGAWALSRAVQKADSLDEIYADCDYISIHIPLNKETKAMFNTDVFAKFKKGMRVLNFSRAELVDDAALLAAIAAGNISAYVTDFPTDSLIGADGVIPIPHLGASTPESEDNCAAMAALQLKDYLEFGNIRNSVNFPDCVLNYTGRKRFCILHKNMPNIIGPITTAVAKANLNIDNMINKSKGAVAYTMIDVDGVELEKVTADITRIDGVISVKTI